MHGRHPHQRGKGHNAAHKTDLRQPKRARICATDCGSPHQTSVPVSCGRSPQLVSHVTVSIVYASMPGIPQELKPPRTQTKQNTTPNTHQRRNPRRSRHAAYDKRLCQLLSTSTSKYPFPKATQQVWTDVLCATPLDLRRLFCSESQEVIFNKCYCSLLLFWVSKVVFNNCYYSESQEVLSLIHI